DFDPDAAAGEDSGLYGLPFSVDESYVVVVPVPFEATTSYGGGASGGPAAVLKASRQVDLFDQETGKPYEYGIAMAEVPKKILRWNRVASNLARPIIDAGGVVTSRRLRRDLERVNGFGRRLNGWVHDETRSLLERRKMPVILGGDHSVPFGAIKAYAEAYPGIGILHLDAHADLRDAYEGFEWSHASIFHNVYNLLPSVSKIVQVGVRDLGRAEKEMIDGSNGKIVTFYDSELAGKKFSGVPFEEIADDIVRELPQTVYLSWDIDGLDPTLCPGTGTPVPGGLSWHEAIALLRALVRARRRIVGLDLCEVAEGTTEWDANVGARLLYKMIGYALVSQQKRSHGVEVKEV
ncbi:MAG: arginase family protein, partial [Thermoanaerobaculia bacterium]|nr:arginase family protein [Thermoanaerobaculia bacterium]